MAIIGLELVDAAVVAVRDGLHLLSSPGVALLESGGPVVGGAAAAGARLKPVLTTDRFWADLALDSFAPNADPPVSHADLAHAHLSSVWQAVARPGDAAVLAVPGSMRLHQVGLALGIARQIGMPVAGIVDAAVAACAGLAAQATVLHLDVQLHQAVLTEMQGATLLRRGRVEVAPRAGLKAMYSAWAQLVSESMVRRTRFDPLHQAATEQQLYERLPQWLAALAAQESAEVSIETDGGAFKTTIRREQFMLAAEAWYAQVAELVHGGHRLDETATLVLSARAATLPALGERLAVLQGLEIAILAETAPAQAAAERAEEIGPGEPPVLVAALARSHPLTGSRQRRVRGANPTHLILDGRAHTIDEHPLIIGFGAGEGRRIALTGPGAGISHSHCSLLRKGSAVIVRDHSRYGTWVNGERVDGEAALGAGDRLRVGTPGVVLELVAVG